jgi:N-acetylmuramic acid 6-phosphate etherase
MKLIVESGSTKTKWCAVSGSDETEIISTIGLNPNFVSQETLSEVLSAEVLPAMKNPPVEEVWFYGAGCSGETMEKKVGDAIRSVLPAAEIHVFSDLAGAARGLLGSNKGFICMLGTGSNSGYYDGENIAINIPPLGFILGDEGSGASLGKKLIADFLRGMMPHPLSNEFREKYGAEKDDIVSHVYRGIFPSRFIGGFVQFLKDHISDPYCKNLIKTSFNEFVQRNLKLYKMSGKTEIAVTGSVAWHFREILEEVFNENDLAISRITRGPIEDLIRYHKSDALNSQPNKVISVTESESLYDDLENMSVRELLESMNKEDQKVPLIVRESIPKIEKLVEAIVERMKKGGRLFYLGSGTSGRLGIVDASEIPPTFGLDHGYVIGLIAGGDKAIRRAVEMAEDNEELGWNDLQAFNPNSGDVIIGIAASGTTPYVIGALKRARENDIFTGAITCNSDTPLAKYADVSVEIITGPEFVTGSTRMKAGTASKLVLNMITTSTMIRLGRVKGNKMVNMQLTNQKLIRRGIKMISDELGLDPETSKKLLFLHGSVKKALDAFHDENQ